MTFDKVFELLNKIGEQTKELQATNLKIVENLKELTGIGRNLTSNCCSAPLVVDVCQDCKEHAGAVDARGREYNYVGNEWELIND